MWRKSLLVLVLGVALGSNSAQADQAQTAKKERRCQWSAFAHEMPADYQGILKALIGQYDQAIANFTEAIRLDPKNAALYALRGLAHKAKGHWDQAIADLTEAISLKANEASLYLARAHVYEIRFFPPPVNPKEASQQVFMPLTGSEEGPKTDLDRAIADCTEAIRLDSEDMQVFILRGQCYEMKMQSAKAIADFTQVIRCDPKNPNGYRWRADSYSQLGFMASSGSIPEGGLDLDGPIIFREAFTPKAVLAGPGVTSAQEAFTKAIADCNEAIRLDPKDWSSYVSRGNSYAANKQYSNAIRDYTRAIRLQPSQWAIYENRGDNYLQSEQYDRAIKDFSTAIRLGDKRWDVYVRRGTANDAKGDFGQAVADYTEAIRLYSKPSDPSGGPGNEFSDSAHADLYVRRARSYLGLEQYDQAIADFTEAIRLTPGNGYPHAGRAWAYTQKKETDKAIADYSVALRLDGHGQDAGTWARRGMAYAEKRDYVKAQADLTQAIRLDPKSAEYYVDRGWIFSEQHDYTKALADFNQALVLDPKNTDALIGRAAGYGKNKQYEKAFADCDQALSLKPTEPGIYLARGEIYYEKGEYGKAKADLQKARELDPNDEPADVWLAWFLATCPEAKLRNGKKAIVYATKACELSDWKEPEELEALAAAYADRGQFDQAIDWEKKALELAPADEKQDYQSRLELYQAGKPFRGPRPEPTRNSNREVKSQQ